MTSGHDLPAPFCSLCGKAMGVYEPLILIGRDRTAVRTSRLKHRGGQEGGLIVHEACYEKRQAWNEDGAG